MYICVYLSVYVCVHAHIYYVYTYIIHTIYIYMQHMDTHISACIQKQEDTHTDDTRM